MPVTHDLPARLGPYAVEFRYQASAAPVVGLSEAQDAVGWRQKVTAPGGTCSALPKVKTAIEDVLDAGLPRAYDKPAYEAKCAVLFEPVFRAHGGRRRRVWVGQASSTLSGTGRLLHCCRCVMDGQLQNMPCPETDEPFSANLGRVVRFWDR